MNFLAHLYLSPKNQDITFGNFIADTVKGKIFNNYSEDIQRGIKLHRSIDAYTDSHPIFKQSQARLAPIYKRYSGVIVDIYYDHFLAKNWNEYSEREIKQFVRQNYLMLIYRFRLLPKRSKYILPFMISQNWLINYSKMDHLQRVFEGMDRRTNHKSGMNTAVISLKKDYESYESDFKKFFPDVKAFVDNQIKALEY